MELSHPQLRELTEAIVPLLRGINPFRPGEKVLTVFDPTTERCVWILHDTHYRKRRPNDVIGEQVTYPSIRVDKPAEVPEDEFLGKLDGLKLDYVRTFAEDDDRAAKCRVDVAFYSPSEGGRNALAILTNVLGVRADSWLFITTHVPKAWPSPLPRPAVWPPAAAG